MSVCPRRSSLNHFLFLSGQQKGGEEAVDYDGTRLILSNVLKLELLHSTTKKLISRKQARLRSTTIHTIHTQVSNTEGILTTFFYPFIPLAYTVSPQFIKSPTKSCQMDDCMFPSGDPDARRWPGIGFTSRIGALEAYPSFMPVVL